jgi:hypothetical protein
MNWLVVSTPLKHINQTGLLLYGKKSSKAQTRLILILRYLFWANPGILVIKIRKKIWLAYLREGRWERHQRHLHALARLSSERFRKHQGWFCCLESSRNGCVWYHGVYHGIPWCYTMGYHGPWYTMVYPHNGHLAGNMMSMFSILRRSRISTKAWTLPMQRGPPGMPLHDQFHSQSACSSIGKNKISWWSLVVIENKNTQCKKHMVFLWTGYIYNIQSIHW